MKYAKANNPVRIAKKFNTTAKDIQKLNGLKTASVIKPVSIKSC
ncbi:LysM domain-containing protein [Providencia hangzhouensis]